MTTNKQAHYSSRTADKFVIRLPDGIRERIAKIAASQKRSMNSQMIYWMEACVTLSESNPDFTDEDLMALFKENDRGGIIVPMVEARRPLPAPGTPVTIDLPEKPYEGFWIVRDYVVGTQVHAVVIRGSLEKPTSSITVLASKLVPL